ncbi:hypothetical protein OPV22_023249 [Ensete ventricosum]|uniref:U-box domain-containing protein n=1 Tax=Ensete ventricosum TaxID=4639 RepID=A0AAV8QSH9_ENSVE|nr:hypothetical protein OPV22_023249 [Ensete ventricosum]
MFVGMGLSEIQARGEGSGDCGSERRVSLAELQGIMDRIRYGSEEHKVQAALEIRRLTKTSSRNRRHLSAAIEPLVSMLRFGSSRSSEAAILGLLNLAVKDERNKISIVEAVNKASISASGAIPFLVNVLQDGRSRQAKKDAVAALYNLSTITDNLKTILLLHPIPPLIGFLKTCKKSSKTAEKCCALLESLVGFDEGRTALTAEEAGVLTVVEILEEGSPQSREHAVGALLTMCESDRSRYRQVILKEGVIPGLLELTVQGTWKSQGQAHRLLELLRDSPHPRSELQADTLQNIVSSIVSKIDGDEQAEKAKKMLAEMVQISMEQSLWQLKQRALVCIPSELPAVLT